MRKLSSYKKYILYNIQSFVIILLYTILPKLLGHTLLMRGLTTLVISRSTNLNINNIIRCNKIRSTQFPRISLYA